MALELFKHETCLEHFRRRLSEGWKCISLEGYSAVLLSPDGIRRELDLRNDVDTLRPNAAGDECNIPLEVGAACPNHYQNVDEEEADDEDTHVHVFNDAAWYRDLYHLSATSGSGSISKITLWFRVRATKDATVKGAIKSGDTVAETGIKNPVTDFGSNIWGTYSQEWATNPDNSQAWDWADLADLQAGINMGDCAAVKQARCTQIYIEVNYTPGATEKTSSDAGSGAESSVLLAATEKSSSDAGTGSEGTPAQTATLAGSESGQGLGAISSQLAAIIAVEVGTSVELGSLVQDLFASELGQGSDSFVVKIEAPTKGGGMKLWI